MPEKDAKETAREALSGDEDEGWDAAPDLDKEKLHRPEEPHSTHVWVRGIVFDNLGNARATRRQENPKLMLHLTCTQVARSSIFTILPPVSQVSWCLTTTHLCLGGRAEENVSGVDAASPTLFVSAPGSTELPPGPGGHRSKRSKQTKTIKQARWLQPSQAISYQCQSPTRRSGKEPHDRRLTSLSPG